MAKPRAQIQIVDLPTFSSVEDEVSIHFIWSLPIQTLSKRARPLSGTRLSRPSGAKGNRTPDLYNAIVALYQLSYGPK